MEDTLQPARRMDYDRILQSIGEFGFYQKRTCLLLALVVVPYGIHTTSFIFQTYKPSYRRHISLLTRILEVVSDSANSSPCAVPGLLNDTYKIQDKSHERLVRAHIPIDSDTGQFAQCKKYAEITLLENEHNITSMSNQNKTSTCDRWVYNVEEFGNSMAVELNLVCEREVYKSHMSMMIMLGMLVGSLVGGNLSDFFGRKKVLCVSIMLQLIPGLALAFVWSIPVILVCRFTSAVTGSTAFLALYVILTEIVGSSRRAMAALSTLFGWCVGMFILLVIQYLIRDWRTAHIVQTSPFFILIVYWWVIQESPRWLLTRGKPQEAEDIIMYIAKVNKVQLPQEMEPVDSKSPMTFESDQSSEHSNNEKIWHICSKPVLAVTIAILAFCWSIISMVYYGLVLGVGDIIEGDIFLNYAILSAVELFSHCVCLYVQEKVGRKKIFCSSIITAGLSCISISIMMITETNIRWLSALIFSLGQFSVTVAFSLVHIVTAELLPTTVRNSGLGFCSFAGRIGGVISSYIVGASLLMSGPIAKAFPVLLFGALSLTSGLLSLWLPETKGRKLPETIDDASKVNRKKTRQKTTDQSAIL